IETDYIKKHISDYIRFQIGQGYETRDIKEVLGKYGYDKTMIDEILEIIDTGSIKIKKTHHGATDITKMTNELYIYLQNLLIEFIIKEKEQGYSIEAIRKALLNIGHKSYIVDAAVNAVELGEHSIEFKHQSKGIRGIPPGFLFFFCMVVLFSLIFFIGVSTGDDILIITLSFFPVLLSLTVVYVAISQLSNRQTANMLVFANVALTVLIYVAMMQLKSPIQKLSDPNTVLMLNIILSIVLGAVLVLPCRLKKAYKRASEDIIPIEHDKLDKDERLEQKLEKGYEKLEQKIETMHPVQAKSSGKVKTYFNNTAGTAAPQERYRKKRAKRLELKPL
ncbi:hypothetical protein JXB31_00785, partial [Candidatus Woesearchaeota archaeon]|nr:hypothetical protein [Candidatus Woesearchaeota archaeon]